MIGKEFLDGTSLDRTERSKVLIGFVAVLFLILLSRIAFIQLIQGEHNLKRSINNRVTLETVKAERGLIYDREGRVLARNRPSYSLWIHPLQVPKPRPLKEQLLSLVDTNGAPFFEGAFLDSIFKAEKKLKKESIGSLDFEFTEKRLFDFLLDLSDKEGTPYFDLLYMDSVFKAKELCDTSLELVARDNSLPYLKHTLLKIVDSEQKFLIDSISLEKRIEKAYQTPATKSRVAEDISIEFVSIIQERIGELDGVFIEMEPRREYTYGEHLFHILGYLAPMDTNDAKIFIPKGYEQSDKIGKMGIEKQYEYLLHGEDGCRYVEKNARNRKLGVIDEYPSVLPAAGKNLYLTIDAELQKTISSSLDDSIKGAVVVLNPQNGEILAMVSNPSFDANIFSSAKDERGKEWVNAQFDNRRPLINKAISGNYPPGSTFKLITGLAVVDSGDENGIIPASEIMPTTCNGTFHFGNTSYDCWRAIGHGHVDLYDAIKSSCNIYFYQVGLRMGYQTINHYAELFNLKDVTGVDIPGEKAGYLSGKEAHNKRHKKRGPGWTWTRGLMMNLSIGQSQSLTPLQIAMIPAGFGNGKELFKPHLLLETRTGDNTFLERTKPEVLRNFNFKPGSVDAIKEGMFRVCNAKGGTGSKTQLTYLPVGGKSGSAENYHGNRETHALFVTLAPLDDPEIAISVVLENAGHGGAVAAPVSKIVLDYYFEKTARGRQIVKKYEGWDVSQGWQR